MYLNLLSSTLSALLTPSTCLMCLLTIIGTSESYLSNFPDHDDSLLEQFKATVDDLPLTKDFMKSDGYLLRWLTANENNVNEAVQKFKTSLKWRERHRIDQIFHENLEMDHNQQYPFSLEGVDKEGRPVIWVPLGTYDVRKVVLAHEEQLFKRYIIRNAELTEVIMHDMGEQSGAHNISQFVLILDMAGFNLKLGGCFRCLDLVPEFSSNLEENYPLIFYRIYVINAATFFHTALSVVRPFISENTKSSLHVFDYNRDLWVAALLEHIPTDQLSAALGGTKPLFHRESTRFKPRNQEMLNYLEKFKNSAGKSFDEKVGLNTTRAGGNFISKAEASLVKKAPGWKADGDDFSRMHAARQHNSNAETSSEMGLDNRNHVQEITSSCSSSLFILNLQSTILFAFIL